MPSIRKNLINVVSLATGKLVSQMSVEEMESLAMHIGTQRTKPDNKSFSTFAKAVTRYYDGITNTLWTNGEKELIENTASLGLNTIFDVGANIGNWTRLAYDAHPKAAIHSFEIVPDTFNVLTEKTSDLASRVHLNDFGLSNDDGVVPVSVDPSSNVLASMLDFEGNAASPGKLEKVDCQVKRGADYCAKQGIEMLDFLKIDVEGAEQQVIEGFLPMIKDKKIRLLQFEYNRGAIISHFLLRDFYELLAPLGYKLGRLFPEGVQFHDYTLAHEDFQGPNYVACLEDDEAMQTAISV